MSVLTVPIHTPGGRDDSQTAAPVTCLQKSHAHIFVPCNIVDVAGVCVTGGIFSLDRMMHNVALSKAPQNLDPRNDSSPLGEGS